MAYRNPPSVVYKRNAERDKSVASVDPIGENWFS